MLFGASDLKGFRIGAADRELGRLRDLYFDDTDWVVRYIVVDAGALLPGRLVLVSPHSAGSPDAASKRVLVRLTSTRIEHGPLIDSHASLSRQDEANMAEYYGWPDYWRAAQPAGSGGPALETAAGAAPSPVSQVRLHSAEEVAGCLIRTSDAEAGHLADIIIDRHWRIQYLIVRLRHLLPGGDVILERHWVRGINWPEREISVGLPRDIIQGAPAYTGEFREQDEPAVRAYYSGWSAAA